jgi:hypothetical protein
VVDVAAVSAEDWWWMAQFVEGTCEFACRLALEAEERRWGSLLDVEEEMISKARDFERGGGKRRLKNKPLMTGARR